MVGELGKKGREETNSAVGGDDGVHGAALGIEFRSHAALGTRRGQRVLAAEKRLHVSECTAMREENKTPLKNRN